MEVATRCLVCSAPTSVLHLGVGCRACTIFYRRAKQKPKPYRCKTGTLKCDIDRDVSAACKRCRFDVFVSHLEEVVGDLSAPSTSTPPAEVIGPTPRPVMDRLRHCYKMLCKTRYTSELSTRSSLSSLDEISAGELASGRTLVKCTYEAAIQAAQILITTLFDFATNAFDEFASFTNIEKWAVIRNFHESFGMLEQMYRTLLFFPDKPNLCMSGYMSYLDCEDIEHFFSGVKGNVEHAQKLFRENILVDASQCRNAMREVDLDEEELIAAFGLELWNTNFSNFDDRISEIFETHRNQLLKELHIYYREVKHVEDYASRIGKIFHMIMIFKSSVTRFRESFEMFRLLDVMDEDNLAFQMYRANLL